MASAFNNPFSSVSSTSNTNSQSHKYIVSHFIKNSIGKMTNNIIMDNKNVKGNNMIEIMLFVLFGYTYELITRLLLCFKVARKKKMIRTRTHFFTALKAPQGTILKKVSLVVIKLSNRSLIFNFILLELSRQSKTAGGGTTHSSVSEMPKIKPISSLHYNNSVGANHNGGPSIAAEKDVTIKTNPPKVFMLNNARP